MLRVGAHVGVLVGVHIGVHDLVFPLIRLPWIGSSLSTQNHNRQCLLDRRPLLFLGLLLPLHKFIKDLVLDESVQALIKSAQNLEESSSFVDPACGGGSVTKL